MKISTKITLTFVVSIIILSVTLGTVSYIAESNISNQLVGQMKNGFANCKKTELKGQILTIKQNMMAYYKKAKADGKSDDEIKQALFDMTRDVVFFEDKTGYIFIYKMNGVNVMHPEKPSLEGRNLYNFKDPSGSYLIQNLIEAARNGGGFVDFQWAKQVGEKPVDKLGYAVMFEPYNWMMGSGIYMDDYEEVIAKTEQKAAAFRNENLFSFTLWIVFISIISIIISYIIISKNVIKPLDGMVHTMTALSDELKSGNGDLTVLLESKGKDELDKMSEAINVFLTTLKNILNETKNLSIQNAAISSQLRSNSMETEKRVEESSHNMNSTTKQTMRIQEEIGSLVQDATVGKENLEQSNDSLVQMSDTISNLAKKVEESAQNEMNLSTKMQDLSKDAEQVKSVLHVISEIADQTNLLALNAAIEAARAGEHGRGFAVVADEVRNLAERTQTGLADINQIINHIVQNITTSSDEMLKNSDMISKLSLDANEAKEQINDLGITMQDSITINVKSIDGFLKTNKELVDITQKIQNVNELSAQNAKSVDEISSTSKYLNEITQNLNEKLSKFRT